MAKSIIEKLMELKQLYEQGILTKEEMEAEKRKILDDSNSDDPKIENRKVVEETTGVINNMNRRPDELTALNDSEKGKTISSKIRLLIILSIGLISLCILFFSLRGDLQEAQTSETSNRDDASSLEEDWEKWVKEKEKRIARINDFIKEQQKKGDMSLERFLRNDDIKYLIICNYNQNYYNAVMDLLKRDGDIGEVEVVSDGTYKGHANVCGRTTGVDPYDDWAIDFSYDSNEYEVELKATVFDVPLNDDGSIDNEGIEKEIERLTAEQREKEQQEIKEIESQAISIETVIDAYKNNVDGRADNIFYKQEKTYHFYLEKIRRFCSDYEYVMEGSGASHGEHADFRVYTNDSRLANLNFPMTLCFRGVLVSIGRPEYGDWFVYHFVCTEVLTYRN